MAESTNVTVTVPPGSKLDRYLKKIAEVGYPVKTEFGRAALVHFYEHLLQAKQKEEKAALGAQFHPLGLVDIVHPANNHDSSEIVEQATELTLVFNDMRLWLPGPHDKGFHLDAIRKRLAQKKLTKIFLVHPSAPTMNELAKTSSKTVDLQKSEVLRAVNRICDGLWEKAIPRGVIFEQRNLQIIGHPNINTYSMIMADDRAYVNYYPIAFRGKDDVGHLHIYRPSESGTGVFERILTDLSWLKRAAEDSFGGAMDLVQLCKTTAPR